MTGPTQLRHLDWRLVALSILVVTAVTQPVFMAAATIGQAGPDLGYGTTELGLITSAFFVAASVSSRLLGGQVERWGWQPVMRLNALGSAAVLLYIAVGVRSAIGLTMALVVAATFYGTANPAANLALARAIPSDRRGLVFGLKHAGIPGSSLLAGLAVPTIALTLGWRWTFGLAVAVSLAVLILLPRSPEPEPARPGRPPEGMSNASLSVLGVGVALASLAAVALGTFHVDAALELGFSEAAAGLILAAGSLTSIVARAIYGYVVDRTDGRGFGFVAALAALGTGAFVALGTTGTGGFVAFTFVAFATGWGWPGLLTYSVVRANEDRPAGSTAITQAGIFVGAGFGPALFGWLVEGTSYPVAWGVIGVALGVAAVIVLVVRRNIGR